MEDPSLQLEFARPGPPSALTNAAPGQDPAAARLLQALQRYWGYTAFLPLQQQAMTCVLQGRDSVVVLPTGGGKSLCFQAPAVCMNGLAIVVSPLISLMKDQVDALRSCGVPAAYVNSTLSFDERRTVAEQVRRGVLKLLYVAPERLLADRTLAFLKTADISFVAIDEAHCISSWGHDFRPEYRGLRVLKQALPRAAVHAYTATASQRVREDIAEQLGLREPAMLVGGFDRPNLVYRVRRISRRLEQIHEIISRHPGESGIVYCISRRAVEATAEALVQLGLRAAPYHAGLDDRVRRDNQDAFINDRVDVIVATVAFGMGIDKSNVRFVIHSGMPKSLEHYQQESGRAGRDGLEADCWLLHGGGDAMTWRRLIQTGEATASEGALRSLAAMEDFCKSVTCRHAAIVRYFGQHLQTGNCGACDVCLNELDLADGALAISQKIVSCVARLGQRFGADYTAKVLNGSGEQRIIDNGHDRLSTYGLLEDQGLPAIREWIEQLVGQGFLEKTGEYNILQITESGRGLLDGEATPRLLRPAAPKRPRSATPQSADPWDGVDRGLFESLRRLRLELAEQKQVPAYVVFSDATLREVARLRPSDLPGLRQVKGVGDRKLADYGEIFLARIREYVAGD